MKQAVERAIEQLRTQFPDALIDVREDGQGGAYVKLASIDLGPTYTEATRSTWIGFHISFQYPMPDIYPHHVRRDLARADGRPLGAAMSFSRFEGFGMDSVQFSRRSNRRDAASETAMHKLNKVIDWARRHP